jgi:hypothetical protein
VGGLADHPSLAAAVSADLSTAGIAHAITGAVAMAAHGYVRATKDVDILVVSDIVRTLYVSRRAGRGAKGR